MTPSAKNGGWTPLTRTGALTAGRSLEISSFPVYVKVGATGSGRPKSPFKCKMVPCPPLQMDVSGPKLGFTSMLSLIGISKVSTVQTSF